MTASTGTRVSFVNYKQQYRQIGPELEAIISDVLARGDFILRRDLEEFEEHMAEFLGVRYAVGVATGTDALFLAVRAAGIGPGDEVISVSHTFVASLAAIHHNGATPVLVDIRDDFNMDVTAIEAAITPRAKGIMPVHLNGRVCEMDPLMEVARRHNLVVIEDAAQAVGATYKGVKAGAFGLASCFSFYPAKILGTAGDGGMLATNDEEIARKVRACRDNGRSPEGQQGYGFCCRLDNLHAALLDYKLQRYLPGWLDRRRELAGRYQQLLGDLDPEEELRLPPLPTIEGDYHDVFQNYVVRSPHKAQLVDHLKESGIEILVNCPDPLHEMPSLELRPFDLPRTSRIVPESFSLPLYPELTSEEQDHVAASIRGFFAR
jgi:dTDP-3-amino-2,3,6-trideoxy-4-keto-D-glucose/dTDP-3-amino-3,4,6-trideoxy-alpha-D-glucose/dTDP-2,6-dideoxy-D-kanosamine transaminase